MRAFAPRDLDGKFLVVVATASNSLNEFVYRKAERRGVLCNVVDVPEYCDFFYPGVVRRVAGAENSAATGAQFGEE